jgi:hypothetical protein
MSNVLDDEKQQQIRALQRLLEGALQIPISVGSTQKAWEEATGAVAAPTTNCSAGT